MIESNGTKSFCSNISSLCKELTNDSSFSTLSLALNSKKIVAHKQSILNDFSPKKNHKILYSFPISTSMVSENVATLDAASTAPDSPLIIENEKNLCYTTLITLISRTNLSNNQNCGSISSRANSRTSTICGKKGERLLVYPLFPPPYNSTTAANSTTNSIKSSLRTELRVARTIAIVVGCFIACWLPFTLVYVLQVI